MIGKFVDVVALIGDAASYEKNTEELLVMLAKVSETERDDPTPLKALHDIAVSECQCVREHDVCPSLARIELSYLPELRPSIRETWPRGRGGKLDRCKNAQEDMS